MIPETVLISGWFAALAAFVAINTAIYVTLALIKTLPRVYIRDYLPSNYQRAETCSIYPDADEQRVFNTLCVRDSPHIKEMNHNDYRG